MSSCRPRLGRPVLLNVWGKRETLCKKSSSDVSNTERAVDPAKACEKAYRAGNVESGRAGFGRLVIKGSSHEGSDSGGVAPKTIKSP